MKKLLTTRSLVIAATVAALAAAGWVGGALAAQGEKASTVTSIFTVAGMTCGGCEAGVKVKVKKLDGVKDVAASYKEGRATVTYDPKKVSHEQIIAAIEELGYSAKLAKRAAKGSKA